jgi:hypothetical protein
MNGDENKQQQPLNEAGRPAAVVAEEVAPRRQPSAYPEPFASRLGGREKRQLGEVFGLRNFGVNLTTLAPGAISALRHAHSTQDEFIYVLQGRRCCARMPARRRWRRVSARAFAPAAATATSSSTRGRRPWSTSRSATAAPATRSATRTTT